MPSEVTLRKLEANDCLQYYVDWLNDPFVNRWLETRHEKQTLETIRKYWGDQQRVDRHLMAICVDGRHVGNIKIGPIHPVHLYGDVSYFIGSRDDWHKGYATKAVGLACDLAFRTYGVHKLQAGVYANNEASMRVLRRNGFSFEGLFKSQLRTENGWDDHVWYGRTEKAVPL